MVLYKTFSDVGLATRLSKQRINKRHIIQVHLCMSQANADVQ